jgi:hypothetical protein
MTFLQTELKSVKQHYSQVRTTATSAEFAGASGANSAIAGSMRWGLAITLSVT